VFRGFIVWALIEEPYVRTLLVSNKNLFDGPILKFLIREDILEKRTKPASQYQSTMMIENNTVLESTSSPVSVFDFSSFVLLRQDETARLPTIAKGAGDAPPTLESITTASSSSLSSISTQDQQEYYGSPVQVQQRKRSIFSHYWKKTGHTPIELTPSTEDSSESVQAEAPQKSRSVMGERSSSYSTPSLSNTFTLRTQTRKSASSSALEVKQGGRSYQSCLRTSRFSGSGRPRSNSCFSAVDFSDQVDVVIYQKPTETYSEEGWSRFFSI
jgi:hypothetical protein